ncbi:Rne/Rng family ribonuclease [Sphingomonas oligophenolica]|uniref:Ribonuclease E n=1 Tax=Sphingomonas oligophenolica TaxID=301154 RepID=A0A502CH70_9SPHN|nr:Rne/Rng family ribonuclease [Sphingomonas oligophenolica]TPG12062.1 Rne/Rng family ribonuclease [Sphingomonas oligophenolica]
MLIDARHREETRVAVVQGNRIEEFDFESAERKQLKGNIYLAKVTRVEPSLQAAFIDYGGNRHGFLAFSEIHPDYYQIPKEDRDALLAEEAEHAAEEAALRADFDDDDDADDGVEVVERGEDEGTSSGPDEDHADLDDEDGEAAPARSRGAKDDQVEALRQRRLNLRRRYKIQDVIHRRQVLLVQVVKEERGNKGAALTTYLSLAGRYCVLMPNTSHGGGISRKISNAGDRKRLKSIMADMKLPPSMGCIVRTAGLQRTKVEIKRDFDYLARLWDGIRETTLKSAAPAVVYGDSDLIKRAIRDIYNKDIEEVIVEGDEGYRQAKDFMKLLMPSHARRVKQYADAIPLYQRAHVEEQLAAMYHPVVQLKSGGYLVINPTEALVSIDINSGRSTREHSIEQTATQTNLEAAKEIARQLRLRDMAGLVVIDFIDMDNGSNVRKVEKAMKEALKDDRARIQVGRISSFGLMEMSRQRLRTGVLEASTRACPHCEGTGLVRTASSAGLSALRLIEDEAARGRGSVLTLRASQEAAFYVLNKKRADIAEIEDRYGVHVDILADREEEGARMSVDASGPPPAHAPKFEALVEEDEDDDIPEDIEDEVEEEDAPEADAPRRERQRDDRAEADGEGGRGKRRRRRRGRGRNPREEGETQHNGDAPADDADTDAAEESADSERTGTDRTEADRTEDATADQANGDGRRRRGRRGRRGGRRDGAERTADASGETAAVDAPVAEGDSAPVTTGLDIAVAQDDEPKPKTRRRPSARAKTKDLGTDTAPTGAAPDAASDPSAEVVAEPPAKPKRTRKKAAATTTDAPEAAVAPEADAAPKPRRRSRKPAADAVDAIAAQPTAPAAVPDRTEAMEVGQDGTLAPDESGDADGDTADTVPRRGGWWQRTFGA